MRPHRRATKQEIARVNLTADFLKDQARRALAGEEMPAISSGLRLAKAMNTPMRSYDPELGNKILACIAQGYNPLYLEQQSWYPGTAVFVSWIIQEPEFYKQFRQALSLFGTMIAFRAMQAAEEPNFAGDMTFEARRKTLTSVLMWISSKANPKQFGDHVPTMPDMADHAKKPIEQTERGRQAFDDLMATRHSKPYSVIEYVKPKRDDE